MFESRVNTIIKTKKFENIFHYCIGAKAGALATTNSDESNLRPKHVSLILTIYTRSCIYLILNTYIFFFIILKMFNYFKIFTYDLWLHALNAK